MNGIICINKPKDWTSFDVVAVIKRAFGTRRVGHGGTLDPMAEGVLPVFIGSATKAVDFCPRDDKEYRAGFRLGITTDTEDITGKILTQCDTYVSRNKMYLIEQKFVGEMLQTPPMYSAVKVGGIRLYDMARKGLEVEREARKITVSSLKIDSYKDGEGMMTVACSRGTYIRTLIADIGKELGTGAVMTSLVRTRSGVFTLDDCCDLEKLREFAKTAEPSELKKLLLPLDRLYAETPKAYLDERQTELFRNGVTLDANRIKFDKIFGGRYTILDCGGRVAGLGQISETHDLTVVQRFSGVPEAGMEKAENSSAETTEERKELFKSIHFNPID